MKITPGIAELIGVIIGDGHIYRKNRKNQIGITGSPITDKDYFKKLKILILQEWNNEVKIKLRSNGLRIVFNSKEICSFLIDKLKMPHGMGKGQRVWIPSEIYSNWKLAKHTIRGIIDTDGTIFVSKKPGIEKYPTIEITTTSKNLANQLNLLLNKNNFRAVLRLEKRRKINPNALPPYKVTLYGRNNLKKWIEEIGFTNPYKKERALSYMEY